jgi:hypothetical protein
MLTSVLLVRLSATGGSFSASPADITEGLDIDQVQGSVVNTETEKSSATAE